MTDLIVTNRVNFRKECLEKATRAVELVEADLMRGLLEPQMERLLKKATRPVVIVELRKADGPTTQQAVALFVKCALEQIPIAPIIYMREAGMDDDALVGALHAVGMRVLTAAHQSYDVCGVLLSGFIRGQEDFSSVPILIRHQRLAIKQRYLAWDVRVPVPVLSDTTVKMKMKCVHNTLPVEIVVSPVWITETGISMPPGMRAVVSTYELCYQTMIEGVKGPKRPLTFDPAMYCLVPLVEDVPKTATAGDPAEAKTIREETMTVVVEGPTRMFRMEWSIVNNTHARQFVSWAGGDGMWMEPGETKKTMVKPTPCMPNVVMCQDNRDEQDCALFRVSAGGGWVARTHLGEVEVHLLSMVAE